MSASDEPCQLMTLGTQTDLISIDAFDCAVADLMFVYRWVKPFQCLIHLLILLPINLGTYSATTCWIHSTGLLRHRMLPLSYNRLCMRSTLSVAAMSFLM
jgi:hypothetical protein